MKSFVVMSVIGLGLSGTPGLLGQSPPALSLQRVATGLSRPLFVTAPPGDTSRLFVLEQHTGAIRILDLSTQEVQAQPFLRISGITMGGEQGLLGLAFHPGYATNGYFFVNYTTSGDGPAGHTEVVRYRVQGDPATATSADPASKLVLLTFSQPESNHNGGWLGFGPDGYLYISTGDGGGANDQHGSMGNGQNRAVLLGKILRIDVDSGSPYGIPEGNPFQNMTDARPEIWAFGLRNPWRCSFDRLTGELWIGDVGQGTREEIDLAPKGVGGLNFGWRPREGAIQTPAYPQEKPVSSATEPIHDYPRTAGASVTGGYVYRGSAIPDLQGQYIFADYVSARFWTLQTNVTGRATVVERTQELNPGTASTRPIRGPSSFGEDAAGELYVCDLVDGEVYRIASSQPALTLLNAQVADNVFQFEFSVAPGQTYVVESREALSGAAWQPLTNITAGASSARGTVSDPVGNTQRFYRVRTQ